MSLSRDSGDSKALPLTLSSGPTELPQDIVETLPVWLDYKDLAAWARTNKSSHSFFQHTLDEIKIIRESGPKAVVKNFMEKCEIEIPESALSLLEDDGSRKEISTQEMQRLVANLNWTSR